MTHIMCRKFGMLVAVLAMAAWPSPVQAAFIQNSTGLTNPSTTITFDEFVFANGTVITNQYASLGVTFAPNLVYNPQTNDFPNITGNRLGNFGPVVNPFMIEFTSDRTAAAFAMVSNSRQATFTALLDGVVVESVNAPTGESSFVNFYGFTGITFDAIRIDVIGGNESVLLDNIQLGDSLSPVPTPSSLVLVAVGLAGLTGFRVLRRRRCGVAIA